MTRGLLVAILPVLLFSAASPAEAQFAPKITVKYICRSGRYWTSSNGGEKHYCWDLKHYSESTGGVPAFILEYWANSERESKEFSETMKRYWEESKERREAAEASADRYRQQHGLPSLAETRRIAEENHRAAVERSRNRSGLQQSPTSQSSLAASRPSLVEQSSRPVSVPIQAEKFNSLAQGTDRAAVIEALGQPHGAMTNLGADGDEESLTYRLVGGGQASIRLKQGKVLAVRLPQH